MNTAARRVGIGTRPGAEIAAAERVRVGIGSGARGTAFGRLSFLWGAAALLLVVPALALASDGLVVYSNNTTTPQYRTYTGTSNAFGAPTATLANVAQTWVVNRAAPTRNEHMVGYVTTGGVLYILRWNGAVWSNEWTVTVGGGGVDGRRFDVAYENATGNCIVVYSSNSTTNNLRYRIWDGTAWTAATILDSARLTGTANAIKLAARPTAGSNEIAATIADTNGILTTLIWNGSTWGNEPAAAHGTLDGTAGQNDIFDQAYESNSGELVVIYTTSAPQQTYRTYSGGTWGAATTLGATRAAPLQMVAAANPDPASNQILMVWNRSGSGNVYARIWSGTTLSAVTNIGVAAPDPAIEQRTISAGWLTSGGIAAGIVFSATQTAGQIGYSYSTDGGTSWAADATRTVTGSTGNVFWLDAAEDPVLSDRLMLLASDSNRDLFAQQLTWNGAALTWTTPSNGTLTTALARITTQNFDFAYDRLPPRTVTVADGVNPGIASLCPGGAATMLDSFTLQITSGTGTDTVTGVTVSLAAGAAAGLGLVEITNDAGTTVYGSVATPASDTVVVALTTNISVTTTAAQYKVRITPRSHAAMPVPPGSTFLVTGTVTAITDSSADVYSDTNSATITIDNQSPANPTLFMGTAGNAQVALTWTNPADVDFSQVVVLRKAGSAVTDTPVEGTAYSAGATIGASTVVYAGALASFTDTGLTNGTAYYYRIFARDACGNYSTGAAAGPYVPVSQADLSITKTASAGSINANSNVTFTIAVSNAGPGTATTLTVTDTLPAEFSYVSNTGGCSVAGQVLTCPSASLASGANWSFQVVAKGIAAGTPTNTATVASTGSTDPNLANNSSSAQVNVQPNFADLSVTKTGTGSTAIGGTVSYTITVTNNGPATASTVTMTDPIPAGMTWVSSTPSQGSCTGSLMVSCSLGTLNSGASATVTLVVTNNSAGTKANTATVSSDPATDFDPNLTNNNATASTTVTGAGSSAPLCAFPGKDGAAGTISGVVNTYYPGTANVAAGTTGTCITVGTGVGAVTPIAANDLLLVIQMQDADINSTQSNNYGAGTGSGAGATAVGAGRYEFVLAKGAVGSSPTGWACSALQVPISGNGTNGGLLNAYSNAAATTTKGQMRFQVVRVPQFTTATLNGVTALPWSTTTAAPIGLGTGGILAIDVAGSVTLDTGVAASVDGAGFRGAAGRQLTGGAGADTDYRTLSTIATNGGKGEGIAGTPTWIYNPAGSHACGAAIGGATDYFVQTNQPNDGYPNGSMARGAPANAGGGSTDGNPAANDENSGGGGGSNGGPGGTGGYTWSSGISNGGLGAAVTPAVTKLVLGGGGGAGTRNNDNCGVQGATAAQEGQAAAGATGGGLMVIRAGDVNANAGAILSANGSDAYDDTLNDGGGGGGAGGSIIVTTASGDFSNLTIQARGGKGGSTWKAYAPGTPGGGTNDNRHGPGGGGGGGVIVYTNTPVGPALDVSAGVNGTATTSLDSYGAQAGGPGQTLLAGPGMIPGIGAGADCSPDPGVSLTHTGTTVGLGETVTVLATVKNFSPFTATSGTITVVVTLDSTSPGLTPTAVAATGWSCAVVGQQVTCSRSDALAAQATYPVISITATVGATGTAPGTLTNTVSLSPTPGGDYNLTNNAFTDPIGVKSPTLARFRSVAATRTASGVVVSWRTGYEVENLGFEVYRESGGERKLITPSLVAGSALFVGPKTPLSSGRSYAWIDDSAAASSDVRYWVVDVDLHGTRRWTGPAIPLADDGSSLARKPVSASPLLSRVGRTASASTGASPGLGVEKSARQAPIPLDQPGGWSGAAQPGVKILVDKEGWYRVTKADVVAAGFDPGTDPRRLQLFAEGVEQAILVNDGGDGKFDATDSVEFYGVGLDSPFTRTRAYWLVTGQPGQRIGLASTHGDGNADAPRSFLYTVEWKERTLFFAALTNAGGRDNFFGAAVTPYPATVTLGIAHLDVAAAASASLRVALQGVTTDSPHVVDVQVNGHGVGTAKLTGQAYSETTLSVPNAWLVEGPNTVTLVARGGSDDISALSSVALTYSHLYSPDAGALRFTLPGRSRVTLEPVPDKTVRVVDVSDPTDVQELPVTFGQNGADVTATVSTSGHDTATLLAFVSSRVLAPAGIVANVPSTWSSRKNSADFVVIAHPSLVSAVAPLQALRQKQGLSTVVVDVTDVYDEFGYGEKSADAIRSFLSFTRSGWDRAPRYVLFVGDASFDPKNYLGFGDFDLVPTRLVPMTLLVSDCDDCFVDFNGDGLPEMAVGRLAVRTAAEAAAVVSKIVGYDRASGSWTRSVLLVSDAKDEFDYAAASSALVPLVSSGISIQQVKVDAAGPAAAHDGIVSGVNGGQLLVNYFGHGSEDVWSKSDIFGHADATGLTNGSKLPVFVLMTCLNGLFDDLYMQCMAEDLQKAPAGGAVAVWASSALTDPEPQALMNRTFVKSLFGKAPMTLGDAARAAKSSVTDPDVRRSWNLFGDPTMKLQTAR